MIAQMLALFAKNNFFELFSLHLRNLFDDTLQFLQATFDLLPSLAEVRMAKQEILDCGLVEYWVKLGLRESEPDIGNSESIRAAACGLLTEVWIRFPVRVEETSGLATNILANLKRGIRTRSVVLQTTCVAHLFHLLATFADDRNMYAPIIYKTLTFAMIETHTDVELREFFL
jgi:hypothetical protein